MDDNRRKELYSQLKEIISELKEDTNPNSPPVVEQLDDGILRIHIRDAFGTKERIGG